MISSLCLSMIFIGKPVFTFPDHALVAAAHEHAVHHHHSAANGYGPSHYHGTARSGAAGPMDATGANHRIGVVRLKGHGGGKGYDGGGNE
jgi:hypothetical protein